MTQDLIQHQKAVDETSSKSNATMQHFTSCDEDAFSMNNPYSLQWLLMRVKQFKNFALQDPAFLKGDDVLSQDRNFVERTKDFFDITTSITTEGYKKQLFDLTNAIIIVLFRLQVDAIWDLTDQDTLTQFLYKMKGLEVDLMHLCKDVCSAEFMLQSLRQNSSDLKHSNFH